MREEIEKEPREIEEEIEKEPKEIEEKKEEKIEQRPKEMEEKKEKEIDDYLSELDELAETDIQEVAMKGALEEKEEIPPKEKEKVLISYRALNKVLRHGMRFSNPKAPRKDWVECMGFLVGNVDDSKVQIMDAIPIVHGSLVEVEFQNEHYAKADEINQDLTDENWIVGWYHTHPGHGLFLSPVDRVNHSGYQSLNPKAVAIVFDPSKFKEGIQLNEYLKIFRLKSPELGEKSEFVEIENVEVEHIIQDVLDCMVEATMLLAEGYPLVLEYKEEYARPKHVLTEKVENLEKTIDEMGKFVQKIQKDMQSVGIKLESHQKSTDKAIDKLKKDHKKEKRKKAAKCEFCGYDSIMPGDSSCANCGIEL